MFRIDGPGAVGELPPVREGVSAPGFFGPGNPATGQMSTRVTYEWLNAVQEELAAVIEGAGIDLDKTDNGQLLAALRTLFSRFVIPPDGVTIRVVDGKLTCIPYEIGEVYLFRHPDLRPGFQPAQGGIVADAATKYPEIWQYLQTAAGAKLCKTEVEWQAMTQAIWHTNADGTTVGWDGIGGAPYYVQDLNAGTLRLPDLRGMYAEAAGFDSLGAGGVHGDGTRPVTGSTPVLHVQTLGPSYEWTGALGTIMASAASSNTGPSQTGTIIQFDLSRVVPTAAKTQPRAWGALACCYLGQPAS